MRSIMRSGILLILPRLLTQFMGVSAHFITHHLMSTGLTELRATPHSPVLIKWWGIKWVDTPKN
jgi:hypothetical protein